MPTKRTNTAVAIDERTLRLFKGLVEHYLADGRPVGSKTLVETLELGISSATVRNIMADLEQAGLISSPHTSAGRVPTEQGLRLFVDALLMAPSISAGQLLRMQKELQVVGSMADLAESASRLLSDLSHMTGVVRLPPSDVTRLRQIEFIPLSGKRVLAVLVTGDGQVQNRVLQVSRDYDRATLERSSNYLTELCQGKTLAQMRRLLLEQMRGTQLEMQRVSKAVVEMAEQLGRAGGGEDVYVLSGEANLIEAHSTDDMERLRRLFDALEEKSEVLRLLDSCLNAQGVKIFIGEGSGYQFLADHSLVTASYGRDDDVVGVLGVIGPTRMPYDRVVAVVDATAKLLGEALNKES